LPRREAEELLAPKEQWRVVAIEMDRTLAVDWTHEREWRAIGDLELEPRCFSALVASWRDADVIFERFEGRPPCAGVISLDAILRRSA
jgi:hypothetical protein